LSAYEAKDAEFRVSLALLSEMLQPALADVTREVEEVLNASKNVLELKVSRAWSPGWLKAGFPLNSTRIPTKCDDRVLLLETLSSFFHKHAEWQISDYGVTSANLRALSVRLKTAAQNKKTHEAAHARLSGERDKLAARLRTRLRAMLSEVKHVLSPDDHRWASFKLPTPDQEKTAGYQEASERKAKNKAADRQEQLRDSAFRQLSTVRIRAEKLRTRYDRALAALQAIKEDLDRSANDVAAAEAKVEALGGTVTRIAPRAAETTASTPARQLPVNGSPQPEPSAQEAAASVLIN
jgi:hypothetical protein